MTRKLLAVLTTATLIVLVGAGTSPSDAAHRKTFKYAAPCALSNTGADESTTTSLSIDPEVGRWDDNGGYTHCGSEFGPFRPTVSSFTAKVRWYVGGTLVKTGKRTIHNNGSFQGLNLRTSGLHTSDGWTFYKFSKRVTARLTISRAGYRTKTFIIKGFEPYA